MEKENIYNYLDEYYQEVQNQRIQEDNNFFTLCRNIAGDIGYHEQIQTLTRPMQFLNNGSQTNLDNLIISRIANFKNPKQKEIEIMQRIKLIKNAHIRKDGRYEWRKMIKGKTYQVIDSDFDNFRKKVKEIKTKLKKAMAVVPTKKQTLTLHQLIIAYYERYILSQVSKGTLKQISANRYKDAINYLSCFNKEIDCYNKDDIIDFFNKVKQHRTGAYCFFLLKHVFENEFENGNLKRNPIATLKNPYTAKRCMQKGSWLNIEQQKLLKANLSDSIFSKEILFYLMTGCRLKESYDATIDFDKQLAQITRHKTEHSGVKATAVPLSTTFCDYIKNDWSKMFKIKPTHMSQKITNFFRRIGIKDKSTHSLRHTFSTNLYYLGIDPKKQQYLMGHASIKQTFDTYTTLDIAVTKQDILNIWGNLYPTF